MFKTLLLALSLIMTISAEVRIEKVDYKGWPNSHRITNGEIELVVVSDIGPRIMRCAFVGGQNLFKEYPESLGKSGEKEWIIRGGHRLWTAPEDPVISYALDNGPVKIEVKDGVLTATQPVEKETGLQKQIVVKMAPTGSNVELIHRIRNTNLWAVEYATWALTVMAQGGTGITGFPPRGKHPEVLPPTNPLVMWAYTDFSDKRWRFTKKYVTLRQDPKATEPQKLGRLGSLSQAVRGGPDQGLSGLWLFVRDVYERRHAGAGDIGATEQGASRGIGGARRALEPVQERPHPGMGRRGVGQDRAASAR
jgi:hypothetical protein